MSESQLRKGALELMVLGLLAQQPSYGGELLERFGREAGLQMSPGTVYPLLSRLHKAGLLGTRWEESPAGPPRKIYEVTPAGLRRQADLLHEWEQLQQAVAHVVKTEEKQGK